MNNVFNCLLNTEVVAVLYLHSENIEGIAWKQHAVKPAEHNYCLENDSIVKTGHYKYYKNMVFTKCQL